MSGKPIPSPSFLDDCIPVRVKGDRKRWKSSDGKRLFEWDSLHGEIEVYNKRGRHIAVYDSQGEIIKSAIKGRKIDV